MKYLVKLNRFGVDKNIFLEKFDLNLLEDSNYELLVNGNINIKDVLNLQEVDELYELYKDWDELDFRKLSKNCLSLVKGRSAESYVIKTKFLNKIKISAKSVYKHINPYLKHDGYLVNEENPEIILYIEFKKVDKKVFYRLLYGYNKELKVIKMNLSEFFVVLENPSLVIEVSDFLRLCWIFKLPLVIVTKNEDFNKILKKAKEETKGINYNKFELKILDKVPGDCVLVGFSKHAVNNEEDLIKFLRENNKKIAFVFGDDKFGLSQELRNKLNYCFRLTPEVNKPLRASHALSYVLGIYATMGLD